MKRRRRLQVAPSFIRFGNFELFSSQSDLATLKTLADFTIKHHFPKLKKPMQLVMFNFSIRSKQNS
jgi:uncharacterized protein YdiU (UPF0061 family)